MTKSGTITLLDPKGKPISVKGYAYEMQRLNIMSGWQKIYGAKFDECMIQIAPSANPHLVNPDGTNSYIRLQKEVK